MDGLLWKLSQYPTATIDALAKSASHALLCIDRKLGPTPHSTPEAKPRAG